MPLLWIILLILIKLWQRDNFYKKVRKMDNDPNCHIKSDNWYRIHGKQR